MKNLILPALALFIGSAVQAQSKFSSFATQNYCLEISPSENGDMIVKQKTDTGILILGDLSSSSGPESQIRVRLEKVGPHKTGQNSDVLITKANWVGNEAVAFIPAASRNEFSITDLRIYNSRSRAGANLVVSESHFLLNPLQAGTTLVKIPFNQEVTELCLVPGNAGLGREGDLVLIKRSEGGDQLIGSLPEKSDVYYREQ